MVEEIEPTHGGAPKPSSAQARFEEGSADGFRANIRGASLWDLVQMECFSMSHHVVQISGDEGQGYLYFSGGQIVHALVGDLVGEDAAIEILSWRGGSFDRIQREWPERESVFCIWQSLVMRAAQRRDERASQGLDNLVQFPTESSTRRLFLNQPEIVEKEFHAAVHLDRQGVVLDSQGDAEMLSGLAAYSIKILDRLMNILKVEGLKTVQLNHKTEPHQTIMVVKEDDSVLAVQPKHREDAQKLYRHFHSLV